MIPSPPSSPSPELPRPCAFTPRLLRQATVVPLLLLFIPAVPATLLHLHPDSFPGANRLLGLSLVSGPPIGLAWTLLLVEIARRRRPTDRPLPGEVMGLGLLSVFLAGVALAVVADQWGFEEFLALAIVSTPGWLLSFGLLAAALSHLRTLRGVAWATGGYAAFALLAQLPVGPVSEPRNAERALLVQSSLIALAVLVRLLVWWTHEGETARTRAS